MKKIMIGVLIIALICVSSGAYAVLSENATVSNDDVADIADSDIQIDTNNSNEVQEQDSSSIAQTTQPRVVKEINGEKVVYVGSYAYYKESEAMDDYYIRCAECGGFIPIGEATHHLPDAALCHNFKGFFSDEYKDFAKSYDYAYNTWIEDGQPVYDDGSGISINGRQIHEDVPNIDELTSQNQNADNDMPLVDLTVYEEVPA